MTEAVMARRKSAGKRPDQGSGSSKRLSVQASEEWIAWVERGADFVRTDVSKLTDMAIVHFLRTQGFTEPPPKRTP